MVNNCQCCRLQYQWWPYPCRSIVNHRKSQTPKVNDLVTSRGFTHGVRSFGVTGTWHMLQTRYVHTWVSLAMTRRSMDPGQVWSFLVVLVGGGRGLMGTSFFEGCLIFQVGDCSQVYLWGSNLRVRNPEISQVAKLSIQVHFLQEFQCCFPGGTVLVLRKKHDSSESTGARLFHRISRFWSLEGPSGIGIKLDNGKCRSPKLMKRMFNMFQWEIIKTIGDFSFPCLEKHKLDKNGSL